MLYCDCTVNGAVLWQGVPCLSGVPLTPNDATGFLGTLMLIPEASNLGDPTWDQLGVNFFMGYWDSHGSFPVTVPLQATPAQNLNIVLDGQNVTLAVYEKKADPAQASIAPPTAYAVPGYWDPAYSV